MIRINLIATAKGKRRVRPGMPDIPNVGVLLFLLLLVIEGAVLYSMHASASEEAHRYSRKLTKVKRDLANAKKTHAQLTAVRKEVDRLRTQALLFDELEAEKTGPVGAMSFLSFILKPRDEASHPAEELKRMEAAGWRVSWDANRAWFTYLRQDFGSVTLRGAAIHHDDVAEVLRRLESSAYFRNVKLVWQERRKHRQLNKEYIVFQIKSDLIYMVVPYLTAEQRAEKKAAEAEKKAAEAEKKAAAKRDAPQQASEGDAAGGDDLPALPPAKKPLKSAGDAPAPAPAPAPASPTQPSSAQPSPAQPSPAQPSSAQPDSAQPSSTKPSPTKPNQAEEQP